MNLTTKVLILTNVLAWGFCAAEWLHRRWTLKRLGRKSAWLEQYKPGAFRINERSKETEDDYLA